MKLLKEIVHNRNLNIEGNTIYREAVRAIIVKKNKILMIYSRNNGDYKFPGGGGDSNETYEEALRREVKEEAGASILRIDKEFGKVVEYDSPLEKEYDVFNMTSFYYICTIDTVFTEQKLDQYEKELGFEAAWVDIDDAINANKFVINSNLHKKPRWIGRETFILEQVKERLF